MTGVITTIPRMQFSTAQGAPLGGGKLHVYLAGTTTPADTFQDQALTIKNENPIELDATGSAVIWLDPAKVYKFLLKNNLGVTQPGWPVDNIRGAARAADLYDLNALLNGPEGAAQIGAQTPGGTITSVAARLFDEVKTADYPNFAEALIAATGKSLIVNSSVPIVGNTTVPANVALDVRLGGMFNISAGVTLTIAGPLKAGEYRIFSGAGTVVFAVTSRAKGLHVWSGGARTAVFSTNRTLYQSPTDVGGPVHAFEDNCTLNFTNPKAENFNAYAAFDANTVATGPGAYDHMVGFQSRQTYSGSGEIWARMDGFNCLHTHNGTGVVKVMRGLHIENPLGTGQIDFLAGVLIQRLNRGGETYGIYCATTQNVISTGYGEAANWLLRGNGQQGGYGLLMQSSVDSAAWVMNTADKELKFGTNNLERMRLTNTGLLKIGSQAVILTDNSQVEVQGYGGITLKATGGAGAACSLNWNNATAGDNLFSVFYTEAEVTQRGSIDFNRGAGQIRYNTTSDGTLKNLIGDAPVEKSLEILASARLRSYTWKDDPDGKVQIGPIAQELHGTYPGAVSVGYWYDEPIAEVTEQRLVSAATAAIPASSILDEEGKPLTPEVPAQEAVYETVVISPARTEKRYRPWGVDKTAFTFHLVAGHQHHTKQIADLQTQVADLAARLAQLEGKPA